MARNSKYISKNQISMFDSGLLLPGEQRVKPTDAILMHAKNTSFKLDKEQNKEIRRNILPDPTPLQTERYKLYKSTSKFGGLSIIISCIMCISLVYYKQSGSLIDNQYFNVLYGMKLNSYVLSGILRVLILFFNSIAILAFAYAFHKLWQSGDFYMSALHPSNASNNPKRVILLLILIALIPVSVTLWIAFIYSQKDFFVLWQYLWNNFSISSEPWKYDLKKFGA